MVMGLLSGTWCRDIFQKQPALRGWQREAKRAKTGKKGKKRLFALFAGFCLFCFPTVFFTASLNQQKCLVISCQ
jgi:hypothetical protein